MKQVDIIDTFNLVTYRRDGAVRPGLHAEGTVFDLAALLAADARDEAAESSAWGDSLASVLASWNEAEPILARIRQALPSSDSPDGWPLGEVELCAPLPDLQAIFCAAANFTDHMQEMSGRTPPDKSTTRPYFFLKTARHSLIGPGDEIWTAHDSDQLDWEAEIGVVIGSPAYRVSRDQAMDHVAGYVILNDLTLRDQTKRSDWNFGNDWFRAKSFDHSAPMGPWITPARFVADPHQLDIRLWVNDELMQDSSSRFMHFSVGELIEYLSEQLTLQPGDVIASGTPAGVGRARGRYLQAGDSVKIEIDQLGTLRNAVVTHPSPPAGGARS
jgi:2-keto-4-pentenoate hydratase/2-oxohepta-3-ene-1,7-dioic acid hydratase in catechol pathway